MLMKHLKISLWPYRESNPDLHLERVPSWPLDDRASLFVWLFYHAWVFVAIGKVNWKAESFVFLPVWSGYREEGLCWCHQVLSCPGIKFSYISFVYQIFFHFKHPFVVCCFPGKETRLWRVFKPSFNSGGSLKGEVFCESVIDQKIICLSERVFSCKNACKVFNCMVFSGKGGVFWTVARKVSCQTFFRFYVKR